MIYGLCEIGLWKSHQLKNTIIWTASVGALSLFQLEKMKKDSQSFKKLVFDDLKLAALIQFIVGVYTFNIVAELIMVPALVVLGGTLAVVQSDKKFTGLEKPISNTMSAFGLFLILFTVYMLLTNLAEFANEKTIYDFATPPLLTLLYLPFIFLMMVFTTYESVFIRFKIAIKDPAVLRYAKIYSALKFHVRIKSLERWAKLLICEGISGGIISKARIKETVNELFKIVATERNPPVIPKEKVWSPYIAKNFLNKEGLSTGYYDPVSFASNDEWYASSQLVKFGDGTFQNQISYSISGNETLANELDLRATIFSPEFSQSAHLKLLNCIKVLMQKALHVELIGDIEEIISKAKPFVHQSENFVISFGKKIFSADLGTYELTFKIAHVGRVEE